MHAGRPRRTLVPMAFQPDDLAPLPGDGPGLPPELAPLQAGEQLPPPEQRSGDEGKVPEPGSSWLAGSALAALILLRRRARRG